MIEFSKDSDDITLIWHRICERVSSTIQDWFFFFLKKGTNLLSFSLLIIIIIISE